MLIKKLGVQALPGQNVEVQLIDGNEILYNIVWPKAGKVHHIADIFHKAFKPTQNVEVMSYLTNMMMHQSKPMRETEELRMLSTPVTKLQ